jgi:hypothetical protein
MPTNSRTTPGAVWALRCSQDVSVDAEVDQEGAGLYELSVWVEPRTRKPCAWSS